jgi:hypothetical protein
MPCSCFIISSDILFVDATTGGAGVGEGGGSQSRQLWILFRIRGKLAKRDDLMMAIDGEDAVLSCLARGEDSSGEERTNCLCEAATSVETANDAGDGGLRMSFRFLAGSSWSSLLRFLLPIFSALL